MEQIDELKMSRIALLDKSFSIKLPSCFKKMDSIIARLKYPSDMRPKDILTNEDNSVDYKFTFIDEYVDPDLITELIEEVKKAIRTIYTGVRFYEEGIVVANLNNVYWFEFTSTSVAENLYNIMFYTYINGKLMNGSFCCMLKDSVFWRGVVLENIRTINEYEG